MEQKGKRKTHRHRFIFNLQCERFVIYFLPALLPTLLPSLLFMSSSNPIPLAFPPPRVNILSTALSISLLCISSLIRIPALTSSSVKTLCVKGISLNSEVESSRESFRRDFEERPPPSFTFRELPEALGGGQRKNKRGQRKQRFFNNACMTK